MGRTVVFQKTPCVLGRFDNTLCVRSFRKHLVFQVFSKTPCVCDRFENTLCFSSFRKHLVFQLASKTPCVWDRFENTLCFRSFEKHLVFAIVSKRCFWNEQLLMKHKVFLKTINLNSCRQVWSRSFFVRSIWNLKPLWLSCEVHRKHLVFGLESFIAISS